MSCHVYSQTLAWCGFSGAGTGGLTRQIIPMLQASLHQSPLLKYIATDVTAGFGPNLKAAVQLPQFDFKVSSQMQMLKQFVT